MGNISEIKIALIFYSFYDSLEKNLKKINHLVQALPCATELFLITTTKDEQLSQKNYKIIILDGTDNLLDISAYYLGLKTINKSNFDLFICFNESTFRKYPYKIIFNAVIQKLQLFKEINVPLISGIMHKQENLFSQSSELLNMPYISTFFIVINRKSYRFFEDTYLKIRENQNTIDDVFDEFLDIHLFKSKNPYSWLVSNDIKIKNFKRLTVIFERVLSSEISKNGILINLVDKTRQKYFLKILELIIKYRSNHRN
jgi:hypothetical protein